MLLARRAHFTKVNGDCIVGADDRVDDANADSVSVFLVPQCEERPGTLHEVRGYLPVVCSTMTGYPATRYRLGIH